MKFVVPMLSLLLASTAYAAPAADPVNGKRLFEASKCMACHTAASFTSPTRKVKDLAELESQVRRCDANLSTNWFDDQVLDVVAYLNQAYYKFPVPNAAAGSAPETMLVGDASE